MSTRRYFILYFWFTFLFNFRVVKYPQFYPQAKLYRFIFLNDFNGLLLFIVKYKKLNLGGIVVRDTIIMILDLTFIFFLNFIPIKLDSINTSTYFHNQYTIHKLS